MKNVLLYMTCSFIGVFLLYKKQNALGFTLFAFGVVFWFLSQKELREIEKQRKEDANSWLSQLAELGADLELREYNADLEDIALNLDPGEREAILNNLKAFPVADRVLRDQVMKIDPYGETFH